MEELRFAEFTRADDYETDPDYETGSDYETESDYEMEINNKGNLGYEIGSDWKVQVNRKKRSDLKVQSSKNSYTTTQKISQDSANTNKRSSSIPAAVLCNERATRIRNSLKEFSNFLRLKKISAAILENLSSIIDEFEAEVMKIKDEDLKEINRCFEKISIVCQKKKNIEDQCTKIFDFCRDHSLDNFLDSYELIKKLICTLREISSLYDYGDYFISIENDEAKICKKDGYDQDFFM